MKAVMKRFHPIKEEKLDNYNIMSSTYSAMVKEALKNFDLIQKSVLRTKNMFALGMVMTLDVRP